MTKPKIYFKLINVSVCSMIVQNTLALYPKENVKIIENYTLEINILLIININTQKTTINHKPQNSVKKRRTKSDVI